jgi:hypothetical protein
MTLYRDNPKLKLKTVKTVEGKTEYRKNCRKIKDKFYIINEDCFQVEGKWYVKTSKIITFDYERGEYVVIKNHPLVYGITGFKTTGTPVFGYFTENKYNNVWVNIENYGSVKALNELVLMEGGYTENISDGIWVYRKTLTPTALARLNKIESKKVYTNKGYNIEDNAEEFNEKIAAFNAYSVRVNTSAARYGKMLGETTFGCEIETSTGYIPDHIQNRTGVVICRDGSIDNAEYVTVPMRGAKGLMNLKYLSEELCKRTNTDLKCSFHIHLGTLPKDRLFIIALYALGIRIQEELFTMFPYYKTEWKGVKKQNYNQKLRKLGTTALRKDMTKAEFTKYVDEGYYRIFTWLNDGVPPDDRFNRNNHRHQQTAKWNRKQRYYWLNFMNLFFSERYTAEFRLHHATLNGQKMVNWLFICNAVVRYAEMHAKSILSAGTPIPLDDVLEYYATTFKTKEGRFLSDYLKAYVKNRKDYFLADYKKGDYVSEREQKNDKSFVFEYEGISWLF